MPNSGMSTTTNVRAHCTVLEARRLTGSSTDEPSVSGASTPPPATAKSSSSSTTTTATYSYAQFEPSKGPPQAFAIPTMPDLITLCKNPFHPFRNHALWFQPADQPWDGDKSPVTLAANPTHAAMKRHMRSRAGPMVAVIPHSIDPLPCHTGPLMKISRGKNKSYNSLLFNIPDGAVRLTTLMTILKMSGMSEMMVGDAMDKFMARYNKGGGASVKAGGGGSGGGSKKGAAGPSGGSSGLSALAKELFAEYNSILATTEEGSEEQEEALNDFALMRLAECSTWSLRWCKRMTAAEYGLLEPYQRVNHFPGTWGIGRKDRLHKNLTIAAERFGREHYSFHPEAWLLPQDADALQRDMRARLHKPPGQARNVYIVKRVAGARGAKMHLLQKAKVPRGTWIAQRYVHDPLLIDGYKFDLRIYVAVTSYDPLRVYVYEEGVVRFATSPYPAFTAEDEAASTAAADGNGVKRSFKIKDVAAHLTNYSINKNSKNFVNPTEGCEAAEEGNNDDDDNDDDDDSSGGDDDDEADAKKPATAKKAKKTAVPAVKKGAAAPPKKAAGAAARKRKSIDDDEGDDGSSDDDSDDEDEGEAAASASSSAAPANTNSISERGSKWVISTLRRYLETKRGVAWEPLWAKIEDVIIKTLISVEPTVNYASRQIFPAVSGLTTSGGPSAASSASGGGGRLPFTCYSHAAGSNVPSCFELYGFDVLLREDLTPVLMEVNIMPSLESNASLLDQRVKGNMIADLLTLIGGGYSSKKAYKNRIPTEPHPYVGEVLARLQSEKEASVAAAMMGSAGSSVSSPLGGNGSGAFGRRSSSASVAKRGSVSGPGGSGGGSVGAMRGGGSTAMPSSPTPAGASMRGGGGGGGSGVTPRASAVGAIGSNSVQRSTSMGASSRRAGAGAATAAPPAASSSTATKGGATGRALPKPPSATASSAKKDSAPSSAAKGTSSAKAASAAASGGPPSIYDFHPYFRSRTPAEIDVICTAEEELSRRQHWKRLFPGPTAMDTYGRFFPENRPYNTVLAEWEKEKLRNPPSWLTTGTAADGAGAGCNDDADDATKNDDGDDDNDE